MHLDSRLPKWLIITALILDIAAEVVDYPSIRAFFTGAIAPWGCIFELGFIIICFAMMRGMKVLPKKLTAAWWILITGSIMAIPFLTYEFEGVTAVIFELVSILTMTASVLFIGIMLIIWYEGRLHTTGILLIVNALSNLFIPAVALAFLQDERFHSSYIIVGLIELVFVWVVAKLLLGKESSRS